MAEDWRIQVGEDGDANRLLHSDPILWRSAGEVRGLAVLDAGCGTGYLTRKLRDRGAMVNGVDLSEEMIAIARAACPGVDFRVDSCSELRTQADGLLDLVIATYVLMDTPDLRGTMHAFNRVLRPEGVAVLVFSHPCFPQGRAESTDGRVRYVWDFSYFERRRCEDPPWGHFTSDFIWFHRPLSDYWRAFAEAGFIVADFEEPRLRADRYHLAESRKQVDDGRSRPHSVAFKLCKVTTPSGDSGGALQDEADDGPEEAV